MELIKSNTNLGVEVEIENSRVHREIYDDVHEALKPYWTLHTDNSLREGGIEFVFTKPLSVLDAQKALDFLWKDQIIPPAKVSPRTGIHIHLDIRKLSLQKFRALCIFYALVEEPLFAWVGDNREQNSFCMPWYKADGDFLSIKEALASEKSKFISSTRQINRYAALNLNAVDRFGSLEFRHLQTTFDLDRVIIWINFILRLYNHAEAWEGGLFDILNRYSFLGEDEFLREVFGEQSAMLPRGTIDLGLLNAHDLISNKFQNQLEDIFYAHTLVQKENEGWKKFKANLV